MPTRRSRSAFLSSTGSQNKLSQSCEFRRNAKLRNGTQSSTRLNLAKLVSSLSIKCMCVEYSAKPLEHLAATFLLVRPPPPCTGSKTRGSCLCAQDIKVENLPSSASRASFNASNPSCMLISHLYFAHYPATNACPRSVDCWSGCLHRKKDIRS